MDSQRLIDTARALVAGDRGLLAMDESTPTCDKRFAKLGIAQTAEMRRAYRDMIVTTPNLGRCISGAILYDETIRQQTLAGVPFAQALEQAGIVPGIKVDAGTKPLAGFADEVVTEGLDGLRERLARIRRHGRALREVARRDQDRCRDPERRLHRSQRARAGALRGALPGSGPGADRRAGGADGRRPHARALPRGDRVDAARRLRRSSTRNASCSKACCSSRT